MNNTQPIHPVRQYFKNIITASTTIFEGMGVTFSHMLRKPVTVQYPDRVPKPVKDTLPERYRGILHVDIDLCNCCMGCMKACPIDCIVVDGVRVEKEVKKGEVTKIQRIKTPIQFDINVAKCMYCGLCTEACPTAAIHHTTVFEKSTDQLSTLILRFITPEIAAKVREKEAELNKKLEEEKLQKQQEEKQKPPAPAKTEESGS